MVIIILCTQVEAHKGVEPSIRRCVIPVAEAKMPSNTTIKESMNCQKHFIKKDTHNYIQITLKSKSAYFFPIK